MYYPSSENKGADQLRSYCEADLRLCFRLYRLLVFPCGGSNTFNPDVYEGFDIKTPKMPKSYMHILLQCFVVQCKKKDV